MTHRPPEAAEQLSALADGQCPVAELPALLQACRDDAQLLDHWRDQQLIGELLRGETLPVADEAAFLARLRPALQTDPPQPTPAVGAVARPGSLAANASQFRWRWLASAAVLAGVVVAGYAWLAQAPADAGMALGEQPVLVAGPQGVVIRDAALEELLQAHREQGGASALPLPSGFLRNATFEAEPAAWPRADAQPRR